MSRPQTIVTVLAVICALQAGWIGAQWMSGTAWADDPLTTTADAGITPYKLVCRTFELDSSGAEISIPGSDSEAGRWAMENADLYTYTVDFEAVQKSTGYPQHLVQVCLAPR
ncbi:MAG: hypothetical protein AB8H79_07305 [Myxococcota bacterium]